MLEIRGPGDGQLQRATFFAIAVVVAFIAVEGAGEALVQKVVDLHVKPDLRARLPVTAQPQQPIADRKSVV